MTDEIDESFQSDAQEAGNLEGGDWMSWRRSPNTLGWIQAATGRTNIFVSFNDGEQRVSLHSPPSAKALLSTVPPGTFQGALPLLSYRKGCQRRDVGIVDSVGGALGPSIVGDEDDGIGKVGGSTVPLTCPLGPSV